MKTGKLQKTNFIRQNLPALLIFLFLPLYGFAVVCRCKMQMVDDVTYLFHCVDFTMGFCNKFLPGAVYNLFVKQPSELSATVYEYIWLILFYAVLAFMLQKWLNTLPDAYRPTGIRLLLVYLTGSCTFAAFIYQPGMLDVSWVYLSVIFILCMQNKYTRFLCPLLAIPAVMVHYGVMLCYIPFWALLFLYEILTATQKKEKHIYVCLFFAFCALAVGTFAYFIINNKNNVVYDIRTFNQIIESRGSHMTFYFDYDLYCDPENINEFVAVTGNNSDYTMPFSQTVFGASDNPVSAFFNAIIYQIQLHIAFYTQKDYRHVLIEPLITLFILLPILGLLYGFIKNKQKQNKGNKLYAFFYFCCYMMLPLATVGSVFISTDSMRWLTHGFLCLFTLVLYIMYKEHGQPIAYMAGYFKRFSPAALTVWQLIYGFVIFNPYV